MMKAHSAGVLFAFVAAALISGCESNENPATGAASTEASSTTTDQESALTARSPEAPNQANESQATKRPPPEWTLTLEGPLALQKKGRSAAYTYLDQALHMRLLYNPSGGGFGQGLTFHLPHVAVGQTGKVEASFASARFADEEINCSTEGEETYFSVDFEEFNRDVRVGSFEGRLLCEMQGEARGDDAEPKYAEVSGRFRHD